jgi:alcohol dehydrogenase class IV
MANWRKYIFENDDDAAKQIMLAANYGGRAINITATTAAHAMSYKITSLYKLPHGHAVAVCLPEIWEYMIEHMDKCIDKRGKEYLAAIFDKISKSMGSENPKRAIAVFHAIMKDLGLDRPKAGNRDEELKVLSTSVNPVRLKNNPVQLEENTIN